MSTRETIKFQTKDNQIIKIAYVVFPEKLFYGKFTPERYLRHDIHVSQTIHCAFQINTSRISNVELGWKPCQTRPTESAKAGRPPFTLLGVGKTTHCCDVACRSPFFFVFVRQSSLQKTASNFSKAILHRHSLPSSQVLQFSQLLQVTNTIFLKQVETAFQSSVCFLFNHSKCCLLLIRQTHLSSA